MAAFSTLGAAEVGLPQVIAGMPSTPGLGHTPSSAFNVCHVSLLRPPNQDPGFAAACASAAAKTPSKAGGVASVVESLAADETLERGVVERLSLLLGPLKASALAQGNFRRITFNIPNPRDSIGDLSASHTPLHDAASHFVSAVVSNSAAGLAAATAAAAAAVAMATSKPSPASTATRAAGTLSGLQGSHFPWVYTFRAVLGFGEDSFVRHIEPPASASLELKRLSNFTVRLVPTPNRIVHVYHAVPITPADAPVKGPSRTRYFVRAIVRQMARVAMLDNKFDQYPGPERMCVEVSLFSRQCCSLAYKRTRTHTHYNTPPPPPPPPPPLPHSAWMP